jgi:hypothetical protein
MLENRVQRRIFGPKTDEFTGEWKEYMRSIVNCNAPQILFG